MQNKEYLLENVHYSKTLRKEPALFTIEEMNWEVKLGVGGDWYEGERYWIEINGVQIYDLPEIPEIKNKYNIELARSEVKSRMQSNSYKIMEFPLIFNGDK